MTLVMVGSAGGWFEGLVSNYGANEPGSRLMKPRRLEQPGDAPLPVADPPHPVVLVADDDASVRESLGNLLESEHYEVLCAATGEEALALYEMVRVDVVLLDLNMPVKNGWEVLRRIGQIDPRAMVIVITARPGQLERARACGAVTLMEKPLDFPILLSAIARLSAGRQHARQVDGTGSPPQFHSAPA